MAMYVIFASKTAKGEHNNLIRHFGQSLPRMDNEEIIEIQADCDELAAIRRKFVNLPYPIDRPVVNWYGDTAKFIYHNLRW
jgi:hypothetical protein